MEEEVAEPAPILSPPPLTDKQACRIARAYLKPKLEALTEPIRAEDFPEVEKLPERAFLYTPETPCILPECEYIATSLKDAAKHFRLTQHDLVAFYGPVDTRVSEGITSWPIKMKEWKIASVGDHSVLGTDFFFTLPHLMFVFCQLTLFSPPPPPAATMLELLAEASVLDDPVDGETAGDNAVLSGDQDDENRPAGKRKRVSAKLKSAKRVSRKGVYLDGRPSTELVTPLDCKAPCPLLNSFLASLPPPTSTPVPDLLQVCLPVD
jgi:hypothetical protein